MTNVPNEQKHIAVIGAGLLGRLLSLLLCKQHNVTLFERGSLNDHQTTGRLAAAMVAPIAESVIASEHIVDMGFQSTSMWCDLLAALELENLYQQNGTLVVAHPNDKADLNHFYQRVKSLINATKKDNSTQLQTVNRSDIKAIEPELEGIFNQGLFLANEGHIFNHQLYDQTFTQLQQSSVKIISHCNASVSVTSKAANTVLFSTQGETEPKQQIFDLVIDCRGLAAKQELQNDSALLRGVRGEVIRLKAPDVSISRPIRFMHPRYPIYIVPKPNNEYVVGATEIESDDDKKPSVRSTMELLSAAYSLHKGFSEAEILSIDAGLRPTLLDNEPEISVSEGLIQANGLYRHGYLIAPYVLSQIIHVLNTQGVQTSQFATNNVQLDKKLVVQL